MLKFVLIVAVAVYLAFAAVAYLLADRMIFLPPASSYTAARLPVVHVTAEDGARIAVLHLPHPTASHTILYSHGNAEDLGHLAGVLEQLRSAGFSVLAYDYRGYGASSGAPPTATGSYRDLAAVYRYAVRELRIEPARLILLGRSVGSGPAVHLAARESVGGLVIESGFASAFRVLTRVALLPFDRFPNERELRSVRSPVLVIHGTRDEVIHPRHARALHAAAREPKRLLWIEGAGHNDLLHVAGEEYGRALRSFAEVVALHAAGQPEPGR